MNPSDLTVTQLQYHNIGMVTMILKVYFIELISQSSNFNDRTWSIDIAIRFQLLAELYLLFGKRVFIFYRCLMVTL